MNTYARRVLMLALVAVASLALVACGGESKNDYAKDLTAAVKPVGTELSALGEKVSASSPTEEKVAALDEIQTKLEDVTQKVEGLDPPEDVKTEHDAYIEKLKQLTTDVGALKDAVESEDQAAAQEAAQKLQQTGAEVTEAEKAISDKVNE